jgi:hypothetical protein
LGDNPSADLRQRQEGTVGSLSRKTFVTLLVGATLALLGGALVAGASASTKVKGKVSACVIKQGDAKGLMRFSPSGKCKHGEKKLTWNKRGKRGKRGKAGAVGPAGATGPAGGGGETLTASVSALCSQLSAVTTQLNSLQTVIAGLGLSGIIPPGLVLTIPALPAPLAPFSCP